MGHNVVEAVIQSEAMSLGDVLALAEWVQELDDAIRRELRRQMPGLTDQERVERLRAMRSGVRCNGGT